MSPKVSRPAFAALCLVAASWCHADAIALEDCRIDAGPGYPGIKARCGEMLRPLDPSSPGSEQISLRVAVVPALNLSPQPDPVVPIAGGPGQGSIQFFAATAGTFEALRRNRDILLVDQRGTGDSARMDCDIDDDMIEGQFGQEQTRRATIECLEALPHDPRFFTTSVAVTDLEAVRQALGYGPLNLYGVSYGTRVAQHFARRYPGATRSIVLDGVVPPQIVLGPEIATESQAAIDAAFERCAEEPACAERFGDVAAAFDRVVAQLRAQPVELEVPHPNTGRPEALSFGALQLAGAVRLLAYNPRTVALLPLLIAEADAGNFVPLASQYRMTMLAMSDMLAIGMHNAVICTEDQPFLDPAAVDHEAVAATYMGAVQLETLATICAEWPAGPIDDDFKTPLATDLPVLLLSGGADPITPPRYAQQAAVELRNARLLTGRDQGHGMLGVGCADTVVAAFVEAGDPTDLDARCLERSFVMPFFLDFSGPAP